MSNVIDIIKLVKNKYIWRITNTVMLNSWINIWFYSHDLAIYNKSITVQYICDISVCLEFKFSRDVETIFYKGGRGKNIADVYYRYLCKERED